MTRAYNNTSLKKRLIDSGKLKEECSICGQLPMWNNKKLVLHLDHINGDSSDNSMENLRILCPHCHTQTPTYGGRGRYTTKAEYKILSCVLCDKKFNRLKSLENRRSLRSDGPFCSRLCSNKANGLRGLNSRYGEERLPSHVELTCIRCDKKFLRKTNFERFKSKNRKAGPFCSSSCVSKWNSKKEMKQRENEKG